jgi:TonB family protein
MSAASALPESRPHDVPRLTVELEPWGRTFARNLWDTLLGRSPQAEEVAAAPFWPNVFVNQRLPVAAFRQSCLYHLFVIVAVWGLTVTWINQPRLAPASFTRNQTITYYKLSEYLPALSAPSAPAPVARKGEPEYAKQPIISLPKLPDNSTQTIVDPSSVKVLSHEVKLPNLVAWTKIPATPVAAGARSASQLTLPWQTPSPVAPAPENTSRNISELSGRTPQPAVVQPPPPDEALRRKLGELNIGHAEAAPALPKLAVPEQARPPVSSGPASPNLQGVTGTSSQAAGQLIALGIHPAPPSATIDVPGGNRRGIFAATPQGKFGAPGTPDIVAEGNGAGGTASQGDNGTGAAGNVPAGIYVGGPAADSAVAVVGKAPSSADAQKKTLMAAMVRPHLADVPRDIRATSPVPNRPAGGKIEDEVFGARKYYSMIINMPNLTSGGGSWIIRFAELKESKDMVDLAAPVAVHKVDPAYPQDSIRAHVEGTVVLHAVIHSDGTVGDVRVLRGLETELDESARAALARWLFRPATRRGAAVDLEAVIQIPFTLPKLPY